MNFSKLKKRQSKPKEVGNIPNRVQIWSPWTFWITISSGAILPGAIITLLERFMVKSLLPWQVLIIFCMGFATIIIVSFFSSREKENIRKIDFLEKMVYREQKKFDKNGKLVSTEKKGIIDENSRDIIVALLG